MDEVEQVIDRNMRGTLGMREQLGIYPGLVGTAEVITDDESDMTAVVVGMGEIGHLSSSTLTNSVAEGTLRFAAGRYSTRKPGVTETPRNHTNCRCTRP